MGASVSTSSVTSENNIITKSTNSCGKTVASNVLNISGIKWNPPQYCGKESKFTVDQVAKVDADCFINSLQENLADSVAKLNAQAQTGLGVAVSTNVSDIKQSITSIVENECKGASSTNVVAAKDIESTGCQMQFFQNATAKSKCKIDALQKMAIKSDTTADTTAAGANLGSLLFGSWGGIGLTSLIVLIVVGIIGYYLWSRSQNKAVEEADADTEEDATDSEQKGGNFFNKKNYSITIIMILLVLVVVFVAFSNTSNNQLTVIDLANFQNKVAEAKQIAKLDTISDTRSDIDSVAYPNYDSYIRQSINPIPSNLMTQPYMSGPIYYDSLRTYYEPLI